eukprot:scaffold10226_cov124-Isochrysis_galbana.AAC.2
MQKCRLMAYSGTRVKQALLVSCSCSDDSVAVAVGVVAAPLLYQAFCFVRAPPGPAVVAGALPYDPCSAWQPSSAHEPNTDSDSDEARLCRLLARFRTSRPPRIRLVSNGESTTSGKRQRQYNDNKQQPRLFTSLGWSGAASLLLLFALIAERGAAASRGIYYERA